MADAARGIAPSQEWDSGGTGSLSIEGPVFLGGGRWSCRTAAGFGYLSVGACWQAIWNSRKRTIAESPASRLLQKRERIAAGPSTTRLRWATLLCQHRPCYTGSLSVAKQ